jgi:hypothetical protein
VTLLFVHCPASVAEKMFAGQVTTGASLSLTITLKVHAAILPLLSLAEQLTVFVPFVKVEPDGGAQLTLTAAQLSVALTAYVTLLRAHWPASVEITRSTGQAIVGACVSSTVTVKLHEFDTPIPSVAVQWTVVSPAGKFPPDGGTQLIITAPHPPLVLGVEYMTMPKHSSGAVLVI